jgi:dTDP-4-amino-4,6-dideoxygalactose transaminase
MEIVVPFIDLKKQYAVHQESLDKAWQKTCGTAEFILGPEVSRFEQSFADYLGIRETIGVASGTDALRLAASTLEVGHGDEVLVPANTFIATALAVHALGAVPVPVDIDPQSYLLDLRDARRRLSVRTKALIPVHLYGRCMDMNAVMDFAAEHKLLVIEDACQAHGATWNGKQAGTFGDAGCFSFYPSKNLGAFGDGGLIATNTPLLAGKLRLLRNYGAMQKHSHIIPGENSRLDSIQAAVLNVKLPFLDQWNAARFRAACRYSEKLKHLNEIITPAFDSSKPNGHVFHLFVIRCEQRNELLRYLHAKGIQAGIHYPIPIHLHQAFSFLQWKPGDFPVAEAAADSILSLPIFPEITDEQIDYVAAAVEAFYVN